jgi:hypothetical protein
MDMQISPCNPYLLYVTTDSEGMWRSKDGGATWSSIGNMPSPVSPGVLAINPRDPLEMYGIGGVRGNSVGFWVSHDGGDTWTEPAGFASQANNSVDGWTNDVYDVKAIHRFRTCSDVPLGRVDGDAGVLESMTAATPDPPLALRSRATRCGSWATA